MTKQLINTPSDILNIPIGKLAKYPVEDLYNLFFQSLEILEQAKLLKQWLHSAIAMKYDVFIQAKRRRMEKDTGIIRLEENGFTITNDLQKKVEWQQKPLAKIIGNLLASDGNLSNYIEIYYHIPEVKYNNLPQNIKNILAPARVIKLGNSVYNLTKLGTNLDQEGNI
ncbi:MAG: hypothetical protein LN561_05115 [Rickettsia endosymbiont of Labidopullus appendiculatus]|nr:hypothetical protein [Rickettsia endosymbiont of Labidopullus appendiculatus]